MKALTVVAAALLVAMPALAEDPLIIYPAEGQSKEKQLEDEGQCFIWAREETGFDPTEAVVEVEDPKKKRGGAVRGAAIGAAIGDDSDAAAKGAAVGAARQGRKNRRAQAAADKEREAQEAAIAEQRALFRKATMACLEARGYTVK
ncbi:MAG: hypothetical protein AAGM16_03195 [Pseudomonadota bacterium]